MIITLENFTKSYGEKQLFAGVNLSMDAGDKVGIVGVNGTGKSTFLKAIAGLVPVDDGTMVTMRGLRIEYLAQDKVFDPEHTVLMEVFRGMTPLMDALRGYELALADAAKDPESPAIQRRIMQYAEKIDELDGWQVESTAKTVLQKLGIADYTAKAGTLSGGQQKRLALATALIQPCDLLLLDEPTTYLDMAHQLEVMQIIAAINRQYGMTVVMVLHDINHALQYADAVAVLHEHRIVRQGSPQDVISAELLADVFGVEADSFTDRAGRRVLSPVALVRH